MVLYRPLVYCNEGHQLDEYVRTLIRGSRDSLESAVAIDARNICAYVLGEAQHREIHLDKISGIAPPWPAFWVEWDLEGRPLGFFVESKRLSDEEAEGEGFRWSMLLMLFSDIRHDDGAILAMGPLWVTALCVAEDGGMAYAKGWDGALPDFWTGFNDAHRFDDGVQRLALAILLFAIRFANCRNVERVEVQPKRHEARRAKRDGIPVNSHYVLAIDPNTARKAYGGKASDYREPSRRLHICRGHFAHYTEDAPLFGKYIGGFWIPMHTRGKADFGVVTKDYLIKYPEATSGD